MKNCINSKIIPKKLEIVRKYFAQIRLGKVKVLDIGGVSSYYNYLEMIFPEGEIILLNININDLKGISNSIVGNATQLPFKNETWDIIISFDLIEHLISPDDFLAESYRILKHEGWFVISTPNLADIYSRITFLFGYTPFSYNPSRFRVATPFSRLDTNMGHKSVFTYRGLKQLLQIHGFKVLKSYGYCYCDLGLKEKRGVGHYKIRTSLDKLLPKSMREGILFICRKE